MTIATANPILIEQYLGFQSPAGYRDELIYGRIIVSPDPKPIQVDIAENVHRILSKLLNGVSSASAQRINIKFPDVHSMPSPDVLVIDRAGWGAARGANTYPESTSVRLTVEVLSPRNTPEAMKQKLFIYVEHSIETWIIDPNMQTVAVHRGTELMEFGTSGDPLYLPTELGGHDIKIDRIFAAL